MLHKCMEWLYINKAHAKSPMNYTKKSPFHYSPWARNFMFLFSGSPQIKTSQGTENSDKGKSTRLDIQRPKV